MVCVLSLLCAAVPIVATAFGDGRTGDMPASPAPPVGGAAAGPSAIPPRKYRRRRVFVGSYMIGPVPPPSIYPLQDDSPPGTPDYSPDTSGDEVTIPQPLPWNHPPAPPVQAPAPPVHNPTPQVPPPVTGNSFNNPSFSSTNDSAPSFSSTNDPDPSISPANDSAEPSPSRGGAVVLLRATPAPRCTSSG